MKICNCFTHFPTFVISIFLITQCSETPLEHELDHSSLNIGTITIDNISAVNYLVAPNLGSNESLYLGGMSDLDIPITFIRFPESNPSKPNYWNFFFDSTIVIDSLHFILFSKDSVIPENLKPTLYFSPDSQFNENLSNYLDFQNYTFTDWTNLGEPEIKVRTDTSTLFMYSELIWSLDTSLMQSLSDSLDLSDTLESNLVRSFAIQLAQRDSNLIELYSEEATSGDKDPQIIIYYTQSILLGDSTTVIDTSLNIYSDGDLSIFDPTQTFPPINDPINYGIELSNGRGIRSFVSISFPADTLPVGSVIRSANLFIPTDSSNDSQNYKIFIDPVETDSSVTDSISIYETDPYISIGYPYRITAQSDSTGYGFSIKNILQNILLGNEIILGFKMVADEKNDPFESVWFDLTGDMIRPRLEIIYVYN